VLNRECEMSRRLEAFDWGSTRLGPLSEWPQRLRVAVGICLNSRFPMFVWWGNEYINIYNDAYIPMLGDRHPSAFGQPARSTWADIWDTVGPQADAVVLRGEATWNERVHLVTERNGFPEDAWFTWSYSPIPNDDGSVGGVFCACTEDTQRVHAEARVRFLVDIDDTVRRLSDPAEITISAATRLGEFLNVDRCAYADLEADEDTMNLSGNYLRNEQVKSIVGRMRFSDFGAEVLGLMRANRPYVVNDIDTHEPPVSDRTTYRDTAIQAVICVPLHKDGQFKAAMAVHSATPRHWQASEVELCTLVASRCWESIQGIRVQREAALERERLLDAERHARGESERARRMQDEFLATLSHELRTPLNAISGWAELLSQGLLSDEDAKRALDIIRRNTASQGKLIDDLLDVGRIIGGKLRLEMQPLAWAAGIQEAVESIRPTARSKGVRLEVLLEGREPVLGDGARLQQVAWNLLSNAVKFTPAGGCVSVTLKPGTKGLTLAVSDTGIGIEKDFLPNVFQRFAQADISPTRRYGGLGLGLSIVRQLVEMHNGSVRAESEGEGRGATFSITLPFANVAPHAGLPREPSTSPRAKAPLELSGLDVLVVDDERDTRELMIVILERAGARVLDASGAKDALAILETHVPHVVLSDISMPEIDGYEFVRTLRRWEKERSLSVPAIAVTAFARSEDVRQARAAGFDSHIAKPMDSRALVAEVLKLAKKGNTQGSIKKPQPV